MSLDANPFLCDHSAAVHDPVSSKTWCPACGACIGAGKLLEAEFDDMVNAILRAPHTRRCVQLDDGWACPPECPTSPARPV